jgi:hypothetical protein
MWCPMPRWHATACGAEWEEDMVEINRMTILANMRWKIIDRVACGCRPPQTG